MSKYLGTALLLVCSMGLFTAPAMAQDADNVGNISRGGAEGGTETKLGNRGLGFETEGFKLSISTRVQFRLTYQNEVGNGNDGTNGRDFVNFRVRRAKTTFAGHIFEKEFQYKATLTWAGGANIIEEAFFRWAIMQYINITAGQTKLNWNWEETTSSGSQQFVERSYVNEVFNQDFAKGLTIDGMVGDDTPWLKYWVGLYNGVRKGQDDFRNADQALPSETFTDGIVDGDMMINLRLETHPMGEVKYGMNDQRKSEAFDKPLFAIGLGFNWMLGGFANGNLRPDNSGAGATGSGRSRTSQDTISITLDGHFRFYGLGVDLAYFFRHTEFHNRGRNKYNPTTPQRNGISDLTDSGITFLVTYFILPTKLNVGIIYNTLFADDFWMNGSRPRNQGLWPDTTELGLSVNYYVHGENLKLTFDFLMVSQQLPFGANADGGGANAIKGVYNAPPARSAGSAANNNADYNDLWIVRLQLQWIF